MTDPVPYEPAENIPPIILPGVTPDPNRLHVIKHTPDIPEDQWVMDIEVTVPILEYNLDDTLYYRLIWDNCTDAGGRSVPQYSSPPPAIRARKREITYTLNLSSSPLAGQNCARLVLAVSDGGWSDVSPPYCSPPKDTEGEDRTVVSVVQWWFLVDTGATAGGPGVMTCGGFTEAQ